MKITCNNMYIIIFGQIYSFPMVGKFLFMLLNDVLHIVWIRKKNYGEKKWSEKEEE